MKKGSTDPNRAATRTAESATGLPPPSGILAGLLERQSKASKNAAAVALGRLGGLKGGKARAESLSAKERSAIAQKAAAKRWEAKREKDIIARLQEGKTTQEVAAMLGVNAEAVRAAGQRAMEQLRKSLMQEQR